MVDREIFINGDITMEVIHTDDKIDFFVAVGRVAGVYMTPGQFGDLYELMDAYVSEYGESNEENNQ